MNKKKIYNCYEIILNLVLFRMNLAKIRGHSPYSKAKISGITLIQDQKLFREIYTSHMQQGN